MLFVIKVFVARKWKCKIGCYGFQTKSSHTEVDDEDIKQVEDAANVFDVFLMWRFKSLQENWPRLVIPVFVTIFKFSQTNCDFLIWKRYFNQFGVPRDLFPLCNIVLIWAYPLKTRICEMFPNIECWPSFHPKLEKDPPFSFKNCNNAIYLYMTQFDPVKVSQSLSSQN